MLWCFSVRCTECILQADRKYQSTKNQIAMPYEYSYNVPHLIFGNFDYWYSGKGKQFDLYNLHILAFPVLPWYKNLPDTHGKFFSPKYERIPLSTSIFLGNDNLWIKSSLVLIYIFKKNFSLKSGNDFIFMTLANCASYVFCWSILHIWEKKWKFVTQRKNCEMEFTLFIVVHYPWKWFIFNRVRSYRNFINNSMKYCKIFWCFHSNFLFFYFSFIIMSFLLIFLMSCSYSFFILMIYIKRYHS